MSVIAEFTVPATGFALGRLLEIRPGIDVRLETMVPTGEAIMPYFRVSSDDAAGVEKALRDDPLVTSVEIVDEVDDDALFRVAWSTDIDGLVDALLDTEAVVLRAVGTGKDWEMELRFSDYDALSTFYQGCRQKDIDIDLDRIHDSVDNTGGRTVEYGLSPDQREALLTALEEGYFSVPRETTLVELGEQMDISDSAVSQRLRRGFSKLLAATLSDTAERRDATGEEYTAGPNQ